MMLAGREGDALVETEGGAMPHTSTPLAVYHQTEYRFAPEEVVRALGVDIPEKTRYTVRCMANGCVVVTVHTRLDNMTVDEDVVRTENN